LKIYGTAAIKEASRDFVLILKGFILTIMALLNKLGMVGIAVMWLTNSGTRHRF
jgi:hypothetical protein